MHLTPFQMGQTAAGSYLPRVAPDFGNAFQSEWYRGYDFMVMQYETVLAAYQATFAAPTEQSERGARANARALCVYFKKEEGE